MNVFRTLAAAAALSVAGAAAQAAIFNIGFDAADFDFDGLFDELSTPGPLQIVGGSPSALDGQDVEFFFDITGAGAFTDFWTIGGIEADSLSLKSDDGSSLMFEGLFADLDSADADPTDTVILTIGGFRPSPSVIASLAAAPDDFFGNAGDVTPIPLPAAAWMLLAGAGLLVAAGRRRA